MKFQAFHMNPGEKLKKKDVNNDLSNFMSVFPNRYQVVVTNLYININEFQPWTYIELTSVYLKKIMQ